jgi:hypothetical protein
MSAFDDAAFDRTAWLGLQARTVRTGGRLQGRTPAVHAGIGSFEEVAAITEGELLAIDEIDPVRFGVIREVLAEHSFDRRRLRRDRPESVSFTPSEARGCVCRSCAWASL